MASGKKSALLSSLAAYGDDSEPDSDPDTDEHGTVQCGLFNLISGSLTVGNEQKVSELHALLLLLVSGSARGHYSGQYLYFTLGNKVCSSS